MKREGAPSLHERLHKPLALAAMVGALAVMSGRGTEAEALEVKVVSKPDFIVGAMEDSVLSEDPARSRAIAAEIAKMGFNTLKLSMPWTHPRQCAEIDNDLLRFQNAARATRENELFFMLNLIPGGGNGLGMAPVTPSQRTCYKDTLISYLHAFEEVNPGGHIAVELPNEPNSETFWRPQKDKDGEWIAPKDVTKLLTYAYNPLKEAAAALGIRVTVIGGGLASKEQAQQFIEHMGKVKRQSDHRTRLMDGFSHHPYPQTNDESPTEMHNDGGVIGLGDLGRLVETLDESLGAGLPVWLTEYGLKTRVPADKLNQYNVWPNGPRTLVSESQQAANYSRAIAIARCHPRVGAIVLFNVIDDADGHWTSGLMYPDGSAKSSYEDVHQEITQTAANRFANC